MNNSSKRFNLILVPLTVLCFGFLGHFGVQQGMAQDSNKAQNSDAQLKIFKLQTASPELAAQVIQTMIKSSGLRIAVDPRSNGLIASGSPEQLMMIEALLKRLDEEEGASTTVFSLKHISVDEAAKIIKEQLGNDNGIKLVTQASQNALLVSARKSETDRIQSLIEAIDRPAAKGELSDQNVLVYTYWIVDQVQTQNQYPDWKLKEIPDSIKELVTSKLTVKTGIKKPMLAGRIAVQSSVGNSNKEASKILTSGNGTINESNSYQLVSRGLIWNGSSSGKMISLELDMEIKLVSDNQRSAESKVSTQIKTPLNHPICLGMSPVNNIDSILIMEIRKSD